MTRLLPALTTTGVLLAAGSVQAASITAYYDFEGTGADRFDDAAGSFADDLTGGTASAVFSSDTAGVFAGSQSVSFDGSYTLYTDAYTTDLGPGSDAITIMFWIKARDIDQENNNTRLMTSRIRPNGTTSNDARSWQVEGFGDPDNNDANPNNDGQNGDKLDVRYQNGPLYPSTIAGPDATDALARADQGEDTAVWRHVAFVFSTSGDPGDGGAYAQTFVDGSSTGLAALPTDWDAATFENIGGQLVIGGAQEGNGSRDFTGFLDDIALFNGVVSDEDIAAVAAGTLNPTAIPEPGSLALLGLGGLLVARRRRRA